MRRETNTVRNRLDGEFELKVCSTTHSRYNADPGDWSEDNWILVYSNAQPDQMDNPSLALYGDDWEATKAAYPLVAKRALRVKRSLARAKYKVEKGKWTRFQPYTRICVPVRCEGC